MKRIDEIWAWVCIDDDGNEGIPAILAPNGTWMPAIGADKDRIESLRPWILKEVAPTRPVKLVRFTNMTLVQVIRHEGT